jgi:Tfp pilus tip-associated adhesin PilY1
MNKKQTLLFGWAVLVFLYVLPLQADDTDIYFSGDFVNPNVMFVLDASGSMQLPVSGDARDRMEVMQSSLEEVLDKASPLLNVGVMNFSGHNTADYVNGPAFPVSPLEAAALPILQSNIIPASVKVPGYEYQGMFSLEEDNITDEPVSGSETVREFLKKVTQDWDHQRYTPIADALYEASLYYRGDQVDWGKHVPKPDGDWSDRRAAHPSTYSGQQYQRRSVTPNVCHAESCIDDYGQCNTSKRGCHTTTVNCTGNGCGTNCIHHTGTRTETYCTNWITDPEAGNSCASWGTRTVNYDYWQCEKDVTQCVHDACSNVYGAWQTQGVNPVYNSPITESCQQSFMVLLSDGGPDLRNRTNGQKQVAWNKIKHLTGNAGCKTVAQHFLDDPELVTYPVDSLLEDGACGAELTEYMATRDQIDNAILDDEQKVSTFTIGFGLTPGSSSEGYLKLLAKKGEGAYFPATDAESLVDAFDEILANIGSVSSSFSSPVYTIDEQSLLSHDEYVYLPLFDKSNFPRWSGNLKKFKLSNIGASQTILGKHIQPPAGHLSTEIPALGELGQFDERVSDYWSTTVEDGENVKAGGVANLLNPSQRKLYSELTGDQNVNLFSAANRINSTNIAYTDLGLATNDTVYVEKLLKFIQGYEKDGISARHHMGDIIHSKPALVSYMQDGSKRVLYVGTNEGYLHAFDADSGKELFAYMPRALLKNIEKQYKNDEIRGHVYGIDGEITVWRHDENKDGDINKLDGDFIHLYFGLRRGGRDYYALDVTETDRPRLLWKITGGQVSGLGDFTQLGQTWSKPALSQLFSSQLGEEGKKINVLVFGGGYDSALDEADVSQRSTDTMGRAVYIVNALTGELIWKLDTHLFHHSIPADIRVMDMDSNGSIDRLYFGDTGGNIWRVDLDADIRDGYTDSSLYDVNKAKLSLLAELGGSAADKRKFFNETDVSLVKVNGRDRLFLSIGSGYRSNPMNTNMQDRFYVLVDENVHQLPPASETPILDSSLNNFTTLSGQSILKSNKNGWFIELETGEKVLAKSLTFLGKLMFTTFKSAGISSDPCEIPPSVARAYLMDIQTGENVLDLDEDGVINKNSAADRSMIVSANEIVGTPQLLYNTPSSSSGGACTKADCSQWVNIRVGKKLTPLADRNNVPADTTTMINTLDIGRLLPRSFWVDLDAQNRSLD